MDELISFQKDVILFIAQLDSNIDLLEANKKADEFIKDYEKFDYFEFRNSANLSLEGGLRALDYFMQSIKAVLG